MNVQPYILCRLAAASTSLRPRHIACQYQKLQVDLPAPIAPRASDGYRTGLAFFGTVAEWLRSGLQIRVPRFDSGRCLHPSRYALRVASLYLDLTLIRFAKRSDGAG